jgi:VWFA-related protein
MRGVGAAGALVLGLSVIAGGQTTAPSAPAVPAETGQKPVTTIRTNARLVTLDVVVKDGRGHPVHGLKADQFGISENGAPQTITHFEEHAAPTLLDATRFQTMPKLPANVFTNYSSVPASGVVSVVLLDALNTPMTDQGYVRQQMLEFLKTLQPGMQIAIFGLNQRLVMLQGFTADPELLKSVLTKTVAKGSALLNDPVGGNGIQNSMADNLEDLPGMDAETIANLREFEARTKSFQEQIRAQYTLDALNQLARYLSVLPGRKNLIWFSGSFPINILPDTTETLNYPFATMADGQDELRETVTMLSRGQVAVYPVDARGLFGSPIFSAATNRDYSGGRGVARMQQDNNDFVMQTFQEHGTMLDMAAATGGRAFVNTNGLAAAVHSAIEEGSNFYSIAYVPSNSTEDGKLRRIKVRVNQSGLTLAYRQGYYADLPKRPVSLGAPVNLAPGSEGAPNSHAALQLAMMRGAPVPTEIPLGVSVVAKTPAGKTEEKVADGNRPAAKLTGPFKRYAVNIAANPAALNFVQKPDGKMHGDIDLILLVYTATGELLNSQQARVQLAASLEQLKAAANGIVWHQEISTPAKGEYFLRIGMRDEHTDRFGAVEVVTSALRDLPPSAGSPINATGK